MLIFILACMGPGERGALFDADGDGRGDLLITAATGDGGAGSAWLYGSGEPAHITLQGGVQDLWWAGDTDGDGDWELLAQSGSELHLLSMKGGELRSSRSWPGRVAAQARRAVLLGDVNGDGRDDQILLLETGVHLAFGGDVGGAEPLLDPLGLMELRLDDLNQDGFSDLVGLTLSQGAAVVQVELVVALGSRGGLMAPLSVPMPAGEIPSYLRVVQVGGRSLAVVGLKDGPHAWGVVQGKLRPESEPMLGTERARDLVLWGQTLVLRQSDGLHLGGSVLPLIQGPLVRDLDGDGQPELVWLDLQGVLIQHQDGRQERIVGPSEPGGVPYGSVFLIQGQVHLQSAGPQGVHYGPALSDPGRLEGLREAETLRQAGRSAPMVTPWGTLEKSPQGELTWTPTSGAPEPVLHELGGAVSAHIEGGHGVAIGIYQQRLALYRFEIGEQGPGPARREALPFETPSGFGQALR